MFERFLEGVNYYDFPSLEVAIFSLLLAFVLSSSIALTYHFTFTGDDFPNNFFQAIVLSSIVTAMIIMSVGNNLAVGFGIIGAVAVIRFRTLISDPRNMIFMFAGISIGITTGVYGYAVSVSGTVLFCISAILLKYSKYGNIGQKFFEVFISYKEEVNNDLSSYLNFEAEVRIVSQRRLSDGSFKLEYLIKPEVFITEVQLFNELNKIEGIRELKVLEKKINSAL